MRYTDVEIFQKKKQKIKAAKCGAYKYRRRKILQDLNLFSVNHNINIEKDLTSIGMAFSVLLLSIKPISHKIHHGNNVRKIELNNTMVLAVYYYTGLNLKPALTTSHEAIAIKYHNVHTPSKR